jgi:hypothetical protein
MIKQENNTLTEQMKEKVSQTAIAGNHSHDESDLEKPAAQMKETPVTSNKTVVAMPKDGKIPWMNKPPTFASGNNKSSDAYLMPPVASVFASADSKESELSEETKLAASDAASIFRKPAEGDATDALEEPSLFGECDYFWNNLSNEYGGVSIGGYRVNSLDDLEPNPVPDLLAGGAPVDADGPPVPNGVQPDVVQSEEPSVSSDAEDESTPAAADRRSRRPREKSSTPHRKYQYTSPVGPDSKQMMRVRRMLVYLEETGGNEHERLAGELRASIHQCTIFHQRGVHKYGHLPGAIFEDLVERLDGPTVLKIWQNSANFAHPRVDEMSHLLLQADDPVPLPDGRLEDAVNLGFRLAYNHLTQTHGLVDDSNVKEKLQKAAIAMRGMSDQECIDLWHVPINEPLPRYAITEK